MKYKLIVADVDGTLLAPNAHGKTPANKSVVDAVKKAQALGVKMSLATARSLDWVEGLINSLHPQAPIILDNGARVYDLFKKKYIYQALLSTKEVMEVVLILKTFQKEIIVVDKTGRYKYVGDNTKYPAIKIMVLHQPPQIAHAIFVAMMKLANITVTKSISGENPLVESVHVTSSAATKEQGLIRISEYLKIKLDQVIGIGDSYNDAGFLQMCGLKVAMANSVSNILEIADYIAPSYKQDGVVNVIEKFILK